MHMFVKSGTWNFVIISLTEKKTAFDVYPILADFNPIKQGFSIVTLHANIWHEYFAVTTT